MCEWQCLGRDRYLQLFRKWNTAKGRMQVYLQRARDALAELSKEGATERGSRSFGTEK